MPARAPPSGYEDLQRSEFTRLFGRVVGFRAYVAPVVGALALVLAVFETAPWRRMVLVGVPVVLVTVSVLEVLRYRRQGMAPRASEANLALMVVAHLLASLATGALESPILPAAAMLALLLGLLLPDRPRLWAAVAFQQAAFWLFAGLALTRAIPTLTPDLLGGGPRPGHGDLHLLLSALGYTVVCAAAIKAGREMRGIYDQALWRVLEGSDELRREQAERAQALMALTGEIAHELKNPMASVKGLAALLAQQLTEGKGAERLQVLRGEVDRMQVILEGFLNFSRPLLPLSVEPVRLEALCAEVAALHEGVAGERGVALSLRGRAEVRCDARKVRQVLINLVQNALDASPRGGVVELACEQAGTGAAVTVLDRGPGLDPAIARRLFTPGATTKSTGNGMGLTVARSLARQHGGELKLEPRPGGGCAGVLTLPPEPAEAGPAGGAP